ncbi:hypothetical protein H072_1785 [Dactylellina haptotyla CBS 200.50]|uniref:SWI/SNF and RSC complexes subunit Ssr4 C-terminal domain-containing protein n=1 Tax=Dactylellina haptotyla (strain CBS 200.50) TaxID=1284197 RepID=S8BXI1_DACHA|nr:hypothetical protein H072_1785 [Dactylellina haptotyla CBS 200.50]
MMPQAGPYYAPQGHPQMHPQQYMSPHPHPAMNPSMMQTPTRPAPQRGQPTPGGHYGMPPQMMQTPGGPVGPGGPGPSTSKRQRTSQSMPTAGPSNPVLAATIDSVEDEEDTSRGDVLDHINPREISTQRYKQHHEWFEEVFTSPYANSNIEPGSIGIEKLGAWLKPLIDGALEKDGKPVNGKSYKEAVELITKNFEKIIADTNAEIEDMQREHQKQIAEIKNDRVTELTKELRFAKPTDAEIQFGLVLPAPLDAADTRQTNRTVEEIVAEFEQITGGKVIDSELVHCHNPQPEVAAYEETLRQEAAAAAAAAAAANALGLKGNGEKEQETDKMAGVGPSESTSPDNARYLVPVVIEKTDVTGSSSANPPATTTAAAAAQPTPLTASATNEDTPMTDAEPVPAATSTAAPPTAPVQAAATTGAPTATSTPGGLSGTPMSPFVIPSPSPAGFTPQSQSRNPTPGIPTPLPQTAEPGQSQTPNPLLQDPNNPTPGKVIEEPPTVPGEDDLLEGITGGDDDDFDFGGGAAEAMDLLGAGDSFVDNEFM